MDSKTYKAFFERNHKLNSLIAFTALEAVPDSAKVTGNAFIEGRYTNGLHMCNSLYLYTNPPPIGYGTPAPKTAESVNRAYLYNRKTENKTVKIGHWMIENTAIEKLEDFPVNEITGNYNPAATRMMAKTYFNRYHVHIAEAIKETIDWLKKCKADELTKGRQTWDPESEKSITCAKAFSRTMELIENNTGTIPTSLLDVIYSFMEMSTRSTLKIRQRVVRERTKMKYSVHNNLRQKVQKSYIVIRKKTIKGNDKVVKFLFDYIRSFCSYIKHKERGKKDRRAIASANIFLRALLKIVEEFHLNLSKKVPGNTIGVGGDEKKAKILTELQSGDTSLSEVHAYKLQGTEDATKWNECLNPSMFALVHNVFFDDQIRSIYGIKKMTKEEKLLGTICDFLFFVMSIKRIHLGPGVLIQSDLRYTRRNWDEYKEEELNEKTNEWLRKITISGGNYAKSSPGFLMGMLNAASTTIGLLPSNALDWTHAKVTTLRSSDDSMSVYSGITVKDIISVIMTNYKLCKLIGINMSTKKTIFFEHGFGEYTSWYQDKDFVGQSGTETSSIRPGGVNPQEDFNNVATHTAVLLRNHTINVWGAIERMLLGIANIRSLYNIKWDFMKKRPVVFLADGGDNPWDLQNLLIDEATIRWSLIENDEDREYFFKVMSPDNPFIHPPEEQYVYSRDSGTIVKSAYEMPNNIFNYVKRSNNTLMNQTSTLEAEQEKDYRCAYKISTTVDPGLFLSSGMSTAKLSLHISANMRLMAAKCDLNDEEKRKLMDALKLMEEDEEDFEDSVENLDDDQNFNFGEL